MMVDRTKAQKPNVYASARQPHCCFVTVVRRQPRVLTQTITRPSTTIVTYVTLGGPYPEHFESTPTPTPTTAAVIPPPEPEPTEDAQGSIYGSDGSLSNAEIGAILGSVIAFVALLLIAWQCIVSSKIQRVDDDSSSASSSSDMTERRFVRRPRPPPSSNSDDETSSLSSNAWGPRAPPSAPGYTRVQRPARVAPATIRQYHLREMPIAYSNVRHDTRARTRPP